MKKPLKEIYLNYVSRTAVAVLPGTITAHLDMTLEAGQRLANQWRKDEKLGKRSTWFTIHHDYTK